MSNFLYDSAAALPCVTENLWTLAEELLGKDEYLALWMRQAERRKIPDIARKMGWSRFYVRYLLFRAKRKLLAFL